MRKLASLVIGLFFMSFSVQATSNTTEENIIYGNNGKSYIFVVDTVEFSVFPDGQFDFTYIGNNNVTFSTAAVNINYNSGYNYDMFVQYDNYGAVIQIEEVPIYYDEFGRIAQAGDVEIRYNNRRIVRVGGLNIHYNYYGYYSYCTGYINPFNYYYVYQPWHVFYARPVYASCVVYDYPYRRYYAPTRYDYYDHHNYYTNRGRSNVYYTNGRRSFYRPGSRVHSKGGRSVANSDYNPNRRNTAVTNTNNRKSSNIRKENTDKVSRSSKRTEKSYTSNNNNTSRIANNNQTKRSYNSSSSRTQKTSYKRDVIQKKSNKSYASSNKTKSTSITNNSKRSVSNKVNNNKRVAANTKGSSTSKSSTTHKKTASKRGRGL